MDHTDPARVITAMQIAHDKGFLTDRDIQEQYYYNRNVEDWQEDLAAEELEFHEQVGFAVRISDPSRARSRRTEMPLENNPPKLPYKTRPTSNPKTRRLPSQPRQKPAKEKSAAAAARRTVAVSS